MKHDSEENRDSATGRRVEEWPPASALTPTLNLLLTSLEVMLLILALNSTVHSSICISHTYKSPHIHRHTGTAGHPILTRMKGIGKIVKIGTDIDDSVISPDVALVEL